LRAALEVARAADLHVHPRVSPDSAINCGTQAIAGFLGLGACTIAFGSALEEALGGRKRAGLGPALVRAAGVGTIAAGLLRRDQLLLHPPGGVTGQSWHNHGHDLASGLLYAALLVAPLLLARRFRGDPAWNALRLPALATTAGSAALLGLFWSQALVQWGGVIQRVIATVPLGMMAALAVRLLSWEVSRQRSGCQPR